MLEFEAKVIAPGSVPPTLLLVSAPALLMPVPFSTKLRGTLDVVLVISNTAPLATVIVRPAAVPRGVAPAVVPVMRSVALFTLIFPLKLYDWLPITTTWPAVPCTVRSPVPLNCEASSKVKPALSASNTPPPVPMTMFDVPLLRLKSNVVTWMPPPLVRVMVLFPPNCCPSVVPPLLPVI